MPVLDSIHLDFQEAKIKHLLFKSRLRALLYGEEIDDVAPVIYHYECLVGKWLYSSALSDYAHIPEIHDLEQVHTHIHAVAKELVTRYNEGHIDDARAGLNKVEDIAESFITLLEIVEKKVCEQHIPVKSLIKKKNGGIDISQTEIFYELVRKNEILDQIIKKQASELVVSQYMLNNFFMQAPGFFCILRGPQHTFELVNDAYIRLVKRNPVGKTIRQALPELEGQGFYELLDRVYHSQNIYSGNETELFLDKGKGYQELIYVDFVYQPIVNGNKETEGIMVFGYDITEKVLVHKKIRESEKHFRDLVMQSPVPMAVFRGADFIVDLANEALLKNIWRREIHETKGRKLFDLFPELKDQKFASLLEEVYRTGISHREKESLAFVNDKVGLQKFYFDFEYSALFENDDQTIAGIIVTVIDVTEKVDSRQRIKEVEQRSRLAIEASDMATFEWDLVEQKFIGSPRLNEICGIKDKDATHEDLLRIIYPPDRELRNKAVQDSLINGNLNYEIRIMHPDQNMRWVRVHGKIIYNDSREPVRMYGAVMDNTDQKNIMVELKASEEKFRLLVDSMPKLIWMADQKGNMNYFNQLMYDYSGLPFETLKDKGWQELIHPDDRKENLDRWMSSIENGTEFKVEHRIRKHNGEYRWYLSRALPQRDALNNIQMWVCASSDIHEQKNFQHTLEEKVKARTESLQQANTNLERSNKELQQFAYVASHDLQEPVRKISTFSNLIRHKYNDALPEGSQEYLDKITSSAQRMLRLIDDLLNFSRITGTSEVPVATDLNQVLEHVLLDYDELINNKKARISADALPVIMAYELQMTQLFHNLIGNALKFSRENVKPVITITAHPVSKKELLEYPQLSKRKNYIRLVMKDNGIGFEQQYADKIFTIFQRLNDRSKYNGTGIGLALCKKIVDSHEGYISAYGEQGNGAVFTIFLPI